jgi:hypothetical protein
MILIIYASKLSGLGAGVAWAPDPIERGCRAGPRAYGLRRRTRNGEVDYSGAFT